tara:strand:- start:694 stop:861 length:168 start_codon:yes stop_codon:yes gene_type:complete
MDYEKILLYIEDIVEYIEFEEIDMLEIKSKLQELVVIIEDDRNEDDEELEGFIFD